MVVMVATDICVAVHFVLSGQRNKLMPINQNLLESKMSPRNKLPENCTLNAKIEHF
jgi:hypothetical protein